MSADELTCQGGVQINSASINGGGGGESVSVDLPNGPKPGTVWLIDVMGLFFSDTSQVDSFISAGSGFFIVPIGTPPASALDTVTTLSAIARGVPVKEQIENFVLGFGLGTSQFGQLAQRGPIIIPAQFTLRAIIACGTGNPIIGAVQLNLLAQLRILQQQ